MFGAEAAGPVTFFLPLPPFWSMIVLLIVYVGTVYGIQFWVKSRGAPFTVRKYLIVHNYTLVVMSLAIIISFMMYIIPHFFRTSTYNIYCGVLDYENDKEIGTWAYIFFLTKFLELIDTVCLALRGKRITFLHIYHHCAVVLVGWICMKEFIYMGWISSITNACVHVIMYYYFGRMAQNPKQRIWWRRYLTMVQMLQFILDGMTALPFLIFYFLEWPCRGSIRVWFVAFAFGLSLLALFYDFYVNAYKRTHAKKQ